MPNQANAFELVWRNVWVRALSYVVLIGFVVWVLNETRSGYIFALQVGVIGFVLAYVLNPLVALLGRLKIGRAFSVVLIYIGILFLLVLGSVLAADVVGQLGRFIELLPTAFRNIERLTATLSERGSGWTSWFGEQAPEFFDRFGIDTSTEDLVAELDRQFQGYLLDVTASLTDFLENLLREGPAFLISGATAIASVTFQVLLILLASAYFLFDFPKFVQSFREAVPTRYRAVYVDLTHKADRAVGGYLRGQLLITLFIGVFIYIGLSIINVPLALAISVLAAIFNLVPYLGPIIGVVPAVLLGFTESPLTALWAVIIFIIANQVEGNVLAPFILSKSTNLHPVTVLLAILAGAGLLGLVGALLAVPTVALLKVVLDEYLFTRRAYQPLPSAMAAVPKGTLTGDEPPVKTDVDTSPAEPKPVMPKDPSKDQA